MRGYLVELRVKERLGRGESIWNRLVSALHQTRSSEIDCDDCLSHVAEFAEYELAGKPAPEALEAVAHHLSICPECSEEYEKLKKAISEL